MPSPDRALKRLAKKARHGFRGYPVATIAFYGPDNKRASKLVARRRSGHRRVYPTDLRKWFSNFNRRTTQDLRRLPSKCSRNWRHGRSRRSPCLTASIGCPHEEGIDYVGDTCPQCPFWAGRDRWTGRKID